MYKTTTTLASSAVLCLGVTESLSRRSKLPQLAAHHVLGGLEAHVLLAVVHLETNAHKLRKNRTIPGVGADWSVVFEGLGDREWHNMWALPC